MNLQGIIVLIVCYSLHWAQSQLVIPAPPHITILTILWLVISQGREQRLVIIFPWWGLLNINELLARLDNRINSRNYLNQIMSCKQHSYIIITSTIAGSNNSVIYLQHIVSKNSVPDGWQGDNIKYWYTYWGNKLLNKNFYFKQKICHDSVIFYIWFLLGLWSFNVFLYLVRGKRRIYWLKASDYAVTSQSLVLQNHW